MNPGSLFVKFVPIFDLVCSLLDHIWGVGQAKARSLSGGRGFLKGLNAHLFCAGGGFIALAQAREKAIDNRRTARSGGDPLAEKRKARAMLTFEEAAKEAHREFEPKFKNPKDAKAFLSSLSSYAFASFGSMLVCDVTGVEVRQAVLAIRAEKPEAARKLVMRISAVFKWAIANHLRADNPATADALALVRIERDKAHRKALPYVEVAKCIEAAYASGAWACTKLALEFLVLTAARSGEVRGARWDEIDLTVKVWTVSKERMKMKRPHRVPLSPRAMKVLDEAAKLQDASGLVFPSVRGKALSDMTLSKLVKELGYAVDVHGFRTSFRTWAQEQTNFPREIAEAALAHMSGDLVERAYARSDVFQKRRKMMDAWAAFIAEQRKDNVVRIG
jgi:integrase